MMPLDFGSMKECAAYVRGYEVELHADAMVTLNVEFIFPCAGFAGAKSFQKLYANLARWLHDPNGITFVQGSDRPRCFYCGSLNAKPAVACRACGASL